MRGGQCGSRQANAPVPHGSRGALALGMGLSAGAWILVNVTPAVALQLDGDHRLVCPARADRPEHRTVILTDARIDHVAGLLSLREGPTIELFCTPAVFESLTTEMPVLPMLQHYCGVHWHVVPVAGDRRAASFRIDSLPELEFTAIAIRQPALPHETPGEHPRVGDTIALAVRDLATGQRVFCAPGHLPTSGLAFDWMREADCLLVEGPPIEEPADPLWMDLLRDLPARHKVLLATGSSEAQADALARHGVALAFDGMAIEL